MEFFKTNSRGIALCLAIAVPAWILGTFFPIVGGPVIAILLGMLIAIPLKNQGRMAPGIKFTSKKVLQWAVVLLGFGLDLTVVLKTGKQSLPIIVCTIAVSLLIAFVLHKALRIPSKISTLVGVGSSICGGSAIAATISVGTGVMSFSVGVGGLPGFLSIQPQHMPMFFVCMAIAIVVPFVLTLIIGKKKGVH